MLVVLHPFLDVHSRGACASLRVSCESNYIPGNVKVSLVFLGILDHAANHRLHPHILVMIEWIIGLHTLTLDV